MGIINIEKFLAKYLKGEAGEEIAIYNISGSIVLKEIQSSEGGSMSIANLPKGIYLLRAGKQTVKILKK